MDVVKPYVSLVVVVDTLKPPDVTYSAIRSYCTRPLYSIESSLDTVGTARGVAPVVATHRRITIMRSALARATPVVTTHVKRTTTTTTQRRRSVAVRASKVRDDDASSSMACCRPRAARVGDVRVSRRLRSMRAFAKVARDARAREGGEGISHENRSWVSSRAFDRGMRAACVAIASSIDGWM